MPGDPLSLLPGTHSRRALKRCLMIVEEPRNLFFGQRRMLIVDPDGWVIDGSECPRARLPRQPLGWDPVSSGEHGPLAAHDHRT